LSKGGFLEHFMQELEYPDYAHFRSALSEARFQEELCTGTIVVRAFKNSQRQQAGITGDLTARKISSNGSVSVEGKRQLWYTRCHLWVLRKRMLGSLKPSVHQSFRAPFLFLLAKS
jgi:hypothetical protein